MEISLERRYKKKDYTIGNLFIDGKFFSNTLEDTDRGLNQDMSEYQIKAIKIYSKTAIPTGTYNIDMNTVSPKFSKYPFYKEACDGKVPRLQNVKGFSGILIHVADGPKGADLVEGCIGIGNNTIKGGLTGGKETFKKFYNILNDAKLRNESITLKIY